MRRLGILSLALVGLLCLQGSAFAEGDSISGSLTGSISSGRRSSNRIQAPRGAASVLLIAGANYDATINMGQFSDDDSAGNRMPLLCVTNPSGTLDVQVGGFGSSAGDYCLLYAFEVDGWSWEWTCGEQNMDQRNGRYGTVYFTFNLPTETMLRVEAGSTGYDTFVRAESNQNSYWEDDDSGAGTNSRINMDVSGVTAVDIYVQSYSSSRTGNTYVALFGKH